MQLAPSGAPVARTPLPCCSALIMRFCSGESRNRCRRMLPRVNDFHQLRVCLFAACHPQEPQDKGRTLGGHSQSPRVSGQWMAQLSAGCSPWQERVRAQSPLHSHGVVLAHDGQTPTREATVLSLRLPAASVPAQLTESNPHSPPPGTVSLAAVCGTRSASPGPGTLSGVSTEDCPM